MLSTSEKGSTASITGASTVKGTEAVDARAAPLTVYCTERLKAPSTVAGIWKVSEQFRDDAQREKVGRARSVFPMPSMLPPATAGASRTGATTTKGVK
jgi:hypothetical protein